MSQDQIKADLQAVERTRKIVSNILSLLEQSQYSGKFAFEVAESIHWLRDIHNQADSARVELASKIEPAKPQLVTEPAATEVVVDAK